MTKWNLLFCKPIFVLRKKERIFLLWVRNLLKLSKWKREGREKRTRGERRRKKNFRGATALLCLLCAAATESSRKRSDPPHHHTQNKNETLSRDIVHWIHEEKHMKRKRCELFWVRETTDRSWELEVWNVLITWSCCVVDFVLISQCWCTISPGGLSIYGEVFQYRSQTAQLSFVFPQEK